MRLTRGGLVGGVDPELARRLARACHDRWSSSERIAAELHVPAGDVHQLLVQLAQANYLERRASQFPDSGADEWNTTVAGGALTMASFLKPVSRARADVLLAGALERVATYNADDQKPWCIDQVVVFGSYLQPDVMQLGDLDLGLTFVARRPDDPPQALLDYAERSGRRFTNFVAKLGWAQTELLRTIKDRSPYIHIHQEDISLAVSTRVGPGVTV